MRPNCSKFQYLKLDDQVTSQDSMIRWIGFGILREMKSDFV